MKSAVEFSRTGPLSSNKDIKVSGCKDVICGRILTAQALLSANNDIKN